MSKVGSGRVKILNIICISTLP